MNEPHVASVDEVSEYLQTNINFGLTSKKVEDSIIKYGLNELTHHEPKTIFAMIIEQFQDLLVQILLGAALISFLIAMIDLKKDESILYALVEPSVIFIILILNASVGVWQEQNASNALAALKSLQPQRAHALRDGSWMDVDATNLVPGNKVPADIRIIQLKTTSVRCEQSQLTGESESVSKDSKQLTSSHSEIQSKENMLFCSTTISNGCCIGIVTATGMMTEIGKIQDAVKDAEAEEESTPLQKKLDDFGSWLSKVIGVICLFVWLININHFMDETHGSWFKGSLYYLKIAIALAVAAIPEGLPAVITTCLAMGTRKMAARNAIVRRLPSVQTLGCTTVICTDKTGTVTTNEMSVVKVCLLTETGEWNIMTVENPQGYTPEGKILIAPENSKTKTVFGEIDDSMVQIKELAKCGAICNESRLTCVNDTFGRVGEPTEAALKVFTEKLKYKNMKVDLAKHKNSPQAFCDFWGEKLKRKIVLEFCRDRKSMSVLVEDNKAAYLYVKGAPESIVERCTHLMMPDGSRVDASPALKKNILSRVESMAAKALRTLALAVRFDCDKLRELADPSHPDYSFYMDSKNFVKAEVNLVFIGLVGIMDPPRTEVEASVRECHDAGIRVIMITGDNKLTAESIAEQVGIFKSTNTKASNRSFTGKEFEALSVKDQKHVLTKADCMVFSRTEPRHKQVIVKLLKEIGEVVAMTGDGVNDAPALKQADIGIAMGMSGTEVAKEASDMILADDNFSTIVAAVEEGRSIYNNMKSFIRYLISSNIGEVASIFGTAMLGIPEGLAPIQLLWVNLVTDGPPATALGFNPPDPLLMKSPPRRSDDQLISPWVLFRYLMIGSYVGFATIGIFIWWYCFDTVGGHTLVSPYQLMKWGQCHSWDDFHVSPADAVYGVTLDDPCSYFTKGKVKASTLSLTVLVVIEMLNALNALSEDASLIQVPPTKNLYLVFATISSILVHCCVLYIPFLARIFGAVPLSLHDWTYVLMISFPVIIIDEVLKCFGRHYHNAQTQKKVHDKLE
eukprot:GHVL01004432.1.p1 GENE.GHVL01004432.1~~GHVL01004432.1.p1  ORF type:complete len:1023 (+),score=198.59 GHVL01004432.1:58-3126(+)